jgi:hypothetical protein
MPRIHAPTRSSAQAAGTATALMEAVAPAPLSPTVQLALLPLAAPGRVAQRRGGNLPDHLRNGTERLSGMDLGDVRVHHGSSRPAQLNALAYAQGNDIHLAPGQSHHLPHEAWHVVQQRQGRVAPTTQVAGQAVNDDVHLEHEADTMGSRATQLGGTHG